jgi:enterochelin esterase-like enzyme
MPFQVYLPPCYEQASASYPVLYLIHGDGGDETNWFAYGRAAEIANQMIRSGEIPPLILVTPRVDFTHYADVANDFVPHIDGHFRTLADRQHRAVGGASGGADAASCLGLQYPALFESIGAFGGGWCLGSPELLAAVPAGQRPRVFMDDGERDPPSAALGRRSAELLEQNGFEYVLNAGSGDHSYSYWTTNLDEYLRWCAEDW